MSTRDKLTLYQEVKLIIQVGVISICLLTKQGIRKEINPTAGNIKKLFYTKLNWFELRISSDFPATLMRTSSILFTFVDDMRLQGD